MPVTHLRNKKGRKLQALQGKSSYRSCHSWDLRLDELLPKEHKLLQPTQYETDHLNIPVTMQEMES